MNRKDENRFKNQNRECDIVSQVSRFSRFRARQCTIQNTEFDYSYLSYHI